MREPYRILSTTTETSSDVGKEVSEADLLGRPANRGETELCGETPPSYTDRPKLSRTTKTARPSSGFVEGLSRILSARGQGWRPPAGETPLDLAEPTQPTVSPEGRPQDLGSAHATSLPHERARTTRAPTLGSIGALVYCGGRHPRASNAGGTTQKDSHSLDVRRSYPSAAVHVDPERRLSGDLAE